MIKYVHIFWRNENKFNDRVINIINSKENGLAPENHLFVFRFKTAYDACSCKADNVTYDESENLFNKYAKQCNWIISHSIKSKIDFIRCKNKNLHKIIYRYWGGYIHGFGEENSKGLKKIIKTILGTVYRKKLSQIAAIGFANIVDVVDIRKTFPAIPLYSIPYVIPDGYDILEHAKTENQNAERTKNNVLLGHRGTKEDNHIEILNVLESNYGNSIEIYIPLSYGDQDYIENVKQYISKKGFENVHLVTEFLSYQEYVRLLNKMDVGIFDGTGSISLGNISIMLFLGKKIYLNDAGVIAGTFKKKNIPFGNISNLQFETVNDLCERIEYEEDAISGLIIHSYSFNIGFWKKLLQDFQ